MRGLSALERQLLTPVADPNGICVDVNTIAGQHVVATMNELIVRGLLRTVDEERCPHRAKVVLALTPRGHLAIACDRAARSQPEVPCTS